MLQTLVGGEGDGGQLSLVPQFGQKEGAEDGQDGQLGLFLPSPLFLLLVISGQGGPGEEEKGQCGDDLDQVQGYELADDRADPHSQSVQD